MFPALNWDSTAGEWNYAKAADLSADMQPFFKYGDYPTEAYYLANDDKYNIFTDFTGPGYFMPSNCMTTKSF